VSEKQAAPGGRLFVPTPVRQGLDRFGHRHFVLIEMRRWGNRGIGWLLGLVIVFRYGLHNHCLAPLMSKANARPLRTVPNGTIKS